jgi:hypothetical protein
MQMVATAGWVLGRALQALNTVHKRYWWIIPTSYFIALTEVIVIVNISKSELPEYLLISSAGTGGIFGCWVAMWISDRLKGKEK